MLILLFSRKKVVLNNPSFIENEEIKKIIRSQIERKKLTRHLKVIQKFYTNKILNRKFPKILKTLISLCAYSEDCIMGSSNKLF